MKLLKILVISSLYFQLTYAETTSSAWANYIKNPSDENANKTNNVGNGNSDIGLPILEKQVGKGSDASLELAIRFNIRKSGLDGGGAEFVPEIISYGAKVNPQGYLKALEKLGIKECLHIEPKGEEYVDGFNKQKMYDELQEKYHNFKALKKSPIQAGCIKKISSLMKEMQRLTIGVLEEHQCDEDKRVKPLVLFQKKGEEFVLSDEVYQPLQWHIAFDGRYLGVLKEKPIQIENRVKGFGGCCSQPIYRPLVLVSEKNFKDPEKWKPFNPRREVVHKLFPLFKKRVGKLGGIDFETNITTEFNYTEQDVKLFKSYRNNKNERLIQLAFDVKDLSSEGKSDEWFYNYWYYVTKSEFRFIGTNLELVDAGDYDNNGKSEVLFWKSDYNRDGYVLFYDGFKKRVVNSWGYH